MPPFPRSPALPPLVLLCLAATWLIWGSTYLAIKFALVSFPPFVQMGTRFLFAGALLLVGCRLRGTDWPTPAQWANATLVGALMLGGGMGGTAYAEQTVSSGLVVAFIAVIPVLIALFSMIWRVYPRPLEWVGILIGLAGVLLLAGGSGFRASGTGLAVQALSCTAWSLGSVLSQRRLPLAAGAMGFASEMIAGGAVLLAISLASGESATLQAHWPPQPLAVVAWLYLVFAGSLLAFNAYMLLLARTPAALASSYCFVNPVIAMLLGVAVLDEQVTRGEWMATALTLVGVVILLAGRSRAPSAPRGAADRPEEARA